MFAQRGTQAFVLDENQQLEVADVHLGGGAGHLTLHRVVLLLTHLHAGLHLRLRKAVSSVSCSHSIRLFARLEPSFVRSFVRLK